MATDNHTTRYKITVQRTAVEVTLKPSEWGVVKQVEEERDSRFVSETEPSLTSVVDKRGWIPEILTRDVVEREIYSQTVDEIDLAALVSVVNGLKGADRGQTLDQYEAAREAKREATS